MYSYTDIRELICESFSPLIAIESSKSAEQTCREAGVSAIQLLRPFTIENNLNCTIPFESRSIQVKNVTFKLEYTSFIKHMDCDEIEEELLESLQIEKPKQEDLFAMLSNIANTESSFSTNQPWIIDFLSTLLDCCRYSESDLSNHPLAVILVVSSNDPDPIRRFDELYQHVLSRKFFSHHSYSQSIPFFYFLVHSSDSTVNVDDLYMKMQSTFKPSQCKLIRINSLPKDQARSSSPFGNQFLLPFELHSFLIIHSRNACLRCSDADLSNLKEIMHSMITHGVMQNLVKMISSFTQDIINDRRGIANTLFNWFKASSTNNLLTSAGSEDHFVMYDSQSIEFKIRFIADMAFLFGDYETAIEYYKMIIDDYNNNNSNFEVGQVSQMLSFSLFLQGGKANSGGIQIRDVYYYAQQASKFFKATEMNYSVYHSILAISAVVVMLRCNEISRKSRVYSISDFIGLLVPEASTSSLSTAILLAWIGILQSMQHQRQSIFTIVLAAIRFKKAELYEYAIWCCLHAWKLCFNHPLHYIHNYLITEIHSLLCLLQPIPTSAIQFIQNQAYCINDHNQVFSTESSLPSFSSFLQARESLSNTFSYTDLCIPFILPSSIKLQYQENLADEMIQSWSYLSDNREYEDAYAPLIEAISKSSINSRGIPQFNECCSYSMNETKGNSYIQVHQKIAVSFQVQNPLNEKLSILEMKLLSSMNEEMMEVSKEKLELLPFEQKTVSLTISSKQTSSFTITGVSFLLSNQITLSQPLKLPPYRLNTTMKQRRNLTYGVNNRLNIDILSTSLPISIKINGFKKEHFQSELIPLTLSIENHGNEPIQEIFLLTENHGLFFNEKETAVTANYFTSVNAIKIVQLMKPPVSLQHSSISIPCYYYVNTSESRISLYYIILIHSNEEWRMIRCQESFSVSPLLRVDVTPLDSKEVSYYHSRIENINEEQNITEVTMFSCYPYLHLSPVIPSMISPCECKGVYTCIMGVISKASEENQGTSRRIVNDEKWKEYLDFIENYYSYEERIREKKDDIGFIDILWYIQNENNQDRIGFCSKGMKYDCLFYSSNILYM